MEKMSDWELIEAIREDIRGELDAIKLYERHVALTDNVKAKKVLQDIADEEKVHTGELFELLFALEPVTATSFLEGQEEVRELLDELKN